MKYSFVFAGKTYSFNVKHEAIAMARFMGVPKSQIKGLV